MYFSPRLWAYTKGVRRRIAFAALFGLAAAATGIARLALLGYLIGRIFKGEALGDLVGPLIAVIAITLLRAVLQYCKEMVANGTAAAVQRALRRRLYANVLHLGPAYFDQKRTGDATVTLVEGVEQLETYYGLYLPQFFTAALTPLGVFIFMAFLDLPIAGIYLGVALLTLLIPSLSHRLNAASATRRREAYAAFASDFLDSVQGLPTLKAFGQSKARGDALARRAHDVFRTTMWVLASNAATHGISVAGMTIGAAVALAVGAARVNSGAMEIEVLLVVLMLGVEVFRPLRELTQLLHQGLLGISAAGGVLQLLHAEPLLHDAPSPERAAPDAPASIEFDAVHFAYPGGRRPALSGISFTVEPGQQVGVVGRSGAGKSTLMWLLQRLYDPQQGQVRIGGSDLRDLTFDQIRGRLGVVTQDTYLFHGTVADNLRFGKPDASAADLEAAARSANAHAFIARLPQGYDTVIGERGQRLSGGERQRIAIARALLKDAPILILDEALCSVDAENEALIQAALGRLMAGRTTLVMAHRLSSVIHSDTPLVLDEGRLVESGRHGELLARGGAYARLMADQAIESGGDTALPATATVAQAAAVERLDAEPELVPTEAIRRAEAMGWPEATRRLLGLVAPQWPKVAGSFLFGVTRFAGTIGVGVISALVVANVRDGDPIAALLAGLLAVAALTALFTWLESWISHDMAFRLLSQMRIDLYRKLDQLAPGYLQRRRTGDLVAMATQDVETVEYFFAHTVANTFVAAIVPLAVMITLIIFGWPVALALLPFLAIAATSPMLTRASSDRLGSVARTQLGLINAHTVDTLQGLREIAAFQRGGQRLREFDALVRDYLPVRLAFNRQITLQRVTLDLLLGLGGLSVLAVSAGLAGRGDLDAADVPLLTLLAMGAFLPIAELAQVGRRLGDTLGATRRLAAVDFEQVAVRDGPGVPAQRAAPAQSALREVRFAYDYANRAALDGVSFSIAPGSTVAVVGPSGAGKSTAAHLLLRFWDPGSGRITLDGHALPEYGLDDLRGRIALVAQDTYLFNGSIRDNLLIASPGAGEAELQAALERAGLAAFVASLPDGLATAVGERGMQLSGGQRQRIAIGRAVLKDAPLLVLDEATSHLDAVTERSVRQALTELMTDRTTVVIAHRLSTIRDADLIVVLDNGRVAEAGMHDALIAGEGLYARLARA